VKLYNERAIFTPNNIYVDLNFKDVKELLKTKISSQFKDMGDILIFKDSNLFMSINDIGQVNILYNHLPDTEISNIVQKIENSFKQHTASFSMERQDKVIH